MQGFMGFDSRVALVLQKLWQWAGISFELADVREV